MIGIFNKKEFENLLVLARGVLQNRPKLLVYLDWGIKNKVTWSDSMARWCENQPILTYQDLTDRWTTHQIEHERLDVSSARLSVIARQAEKKA